MTVNDQPPSSSQPSPPAARGTGPPGEWPAPEVVGLLGRWWSEGSEYVFRWRDGHLEAEAAAVSELWTQAPAVFEPIGADRWTTVSGREEGESLRAIRSGDGTVRRLYWAGYPFTRGPEVFGAASG
jgi:hypothetical protein